MKYYVEGKVFDTEKEAMDYEKELDAEKERKLNLEKEKENRKAEIIDLSNKLVNAIKLFEKDYGESYCGYAINNKFIIDNIINNILW